jgi:hypothetical protein
MVEPPRQRLPKRRSELNLERRCEFLDRSLSSPFYYFGNAMPAAAVPGCALGSNRVNSRDHRSTLPWAPLFCWACWGHTSHGQRRFAHPTSIRSEKVKCLDNKLGREVTPTNELGAGAAFSHKPRSGPSAPHAQLPADGLGSGSTVLTPPRDQASATAQPSPVHPRRRLKANISFLLAWR